ncbi:hypothetical protein SRHO_G00098470 [Serrasalmus rhombeus]
METEPAQCREVEFPVKSKSAQAKKKHKEKTLKENPDTLYADFIHLYGKRIKNNLIFHTAAPSAWKSAICRHYKFTFKEGISRGGRVTVCTDENLDTDNPVLTITYYTKGTVLVQENEISLESFEEIFPQLNAEVETEAASATVDSADSEEDDAEALPTLPTPAPPPSDRQLRESLALLSSNNIHRPDSWTATSTAPSSSSGKSFHTPSNTDPNNEEPTVTRTTNPPSTGTLSSHNSPDSHDEAAHSQSPPDTQTPPAEPPPSPQTTTIKQAEQRPHVVLLMDSNRKFLEPQTLFPGHQVTAKHCSTTSHAHQLLKKETLGTTQCIIIHTGTNDLHTQQNNTAEAVRRVAERASAEFPESRIVISTLLACSDTPPHVINGINVEISRGCATLPNVHLAYHPTITSHDMYDGLHLHKDSVRIFAKALKDAALGHNTATGFTTPAGFLRPPPQYMPRYALFSPVRHSRPWAPPVPPNSPAATPPTAPHIPVAPRPPTKKEKLKASPVRRPPSQQKPQSYAAAVAQPPSPSARAPPPATTELGEIKQMLYTLCTRLLLK